MYVVYGFCNASLGGGILWEGMGFFLKKRGKVSVRDVDNSFS